GGTHAVLRTASAKSPGRGGGTFFIRGEKRTIRFIASVNSSIDEEGRTKVGGYANPEALIEADEVEKRLKDPNVRVIEVDEDTAAYEKGHIAGAVGWNWSTDLHAPIGRDYVDQAALSDLFQRAGVGADTTVVLYGGNNNWFAAYAYWILKYRGFDNVKL